MREQAQSVADSASQNRRAQPHMYLPPQAATTPGRGAQDMQNEQRAQTISEGQREGKDPQVGGRSF